MELVKVSKPDEMVERVIDGQKRVFQAPKQAELTDGGKQYLEETEQEDLTQYEDLTHNELVEKVNRIEAQIEKLEKKFEVFKNQITKEL